MNRLQAFTLTDGNRPTLRARTYQEDMTELRRLKNVATDKMREAQVAIDAYTAALKAFCEAPE